MKDSSMNNTRGYAIKAKVNRSITKAIVVQNGNNENFSVWGDGCTIVGGAGITSISKAFSVRKGTEDVFVVKGDGSMTLNADISGSFITLKNNNTNRFSVEGDGAILINAVLDNSHASALTIEATKPSNNGRPVNIIRAGSPGYINFVVNSEGYVWARDIHVKANGQLPDYVFDNNYPLMPLSELDKFIKENKHLPDIPSNAEAQKEGLQVGEMQKLLLKKIEELTLYVIELKKENEMLKSKMEGK